MPQQVPLDIEALAQELNEPFHALALLHAVLCRRALPADSEDPDLEAVLSDLEAGLLQLQRKMASLLSFLRLQQLAYAPPPRRVAFPVLPILQKIALEAERPIRRNQVALRRVGTRAMVESDPALVQTVLHNLLQNAVFFSHGGKVLLGCRRAGDSVRVLVGDSGVGIPKDRTDDIFRPFTRLRGGDELVEGLGLGLAVARRLAERLGLDLEVLRSAPGKGSLFALTLPRADAAPGGPAVG